MSGEERPAGTPSLETVLRIGLTVGVLLAFALLLVGLGGVVLQPGAPPIEDALRYPNGGFPRDLLGVARGVGEGRPLAVVQAGLLMLIATPLIRVGLAGLVFCRERDWLFAVVALAVLVLLLWGWRGM